MCYPTINLYVLILHLKLVVNICTNINYILHISSTSSVNLLTERSFFEAQFEAHYLGNTKS